MEKHSPLLLKVSVMALYLIFFFLFQEFKAENYHSQTEQQSF